MSDAIGVCTLLVPPDYSHDGVGRTDTFWEIAPEARFDLLRRYADLHGYACECLEYLPEDDGHSDQTAWWYKDEAIRALWDDCEWVFYTDIDTHCMQPHRRLEEFTSRARDQVWLIGRPGRLRLQLGSFLIRRCSQADKWLRKTYQECDRAPYRDRTDVGAGCDVIDDMGVWDQILTLDPCEFEITVGRHECGGAVFLRHYPAPGRKKIWIKDLPMAIEKMESAEAGLRTAGQNDGLAEHNEKNRRNEVVSKTIYLHGTRRSGNCLMLECMQRNYDCKVHIYDHHLTVPSPIDRTVVVVRNPLSWVPSMYRYLRGENWIHEEMDFAEWSEGDWMQQDEPRDRWPNTPDTRSRLESRRGYCPRVADWNRFYAYWLLKGAHIVRLEDLSPHPEEVCEGLAEHFDLERTSEAGAFEIPQEYVSPGPARPGGRLGCLKRHANRLYMRHWTEAGLGKLRKTVDGDVLAALGYSVDAGADEIQTARKEWEKSQAAQASVEGEPVDEAEDDYDGDVYWIMRGGAGDLVMISHAMRKVLNAGRKIDLLAGSTFSRWLAPVLEEFDGLSMLKGPPPEGAHYKVVACDCDSKTLAKRTAHMKCDLAVSPRSFSGTPAQWGNDLADQILDDLERRVEMRYGEKVWEDRDKPERSDLYNVLRDVLPHRRVPKRVLVGPGTGSGNDAYKKWWTMEKWKEVCGAAPVEFRWLGVGCERPPQWDECPVCGGVVASVDSDPNGQWCTENCGWGITNYIGRTETAHDVLAQMAEGALYVGVDNGLGHMAAACGLPTITVFGHTDPDRYRPNTCNSLTFGEKGRFPEAEPVAEAVSRLFGPVEDPLISMVIATCNEGEELLPTVESARLKAGCPTEVIIVDDGGTDDSVERLPDWVTTIHNENRTGVAPARQQGAALARGAVLVFWDGHMRWSRNCGRTMAEKALADDCAVMAPLKNLYGSQREFGGANFALKPKRGMLGSAFTNKIPDERYTKMTGFVAPCYAIPRETFEHVGGWPSGLKNWGQTEITLSLRLYMAGVPIVLDSTVRMWHMFRGSFSDAGYSGVSVTDKFRNNYRMSRICFDMETFEEFWLPMMRGAQHWRNTCEEWGPDDEEDRRHTQSVRTVSDEEFFQDALGMSISEAKEKYL